MPREAAPVVRYALDRATTALLSVDLQLGFGDHSWEPVPNAAAAVANFRAASAAWRSAGGAILHLVTSYTEDRRPSGRMVDFLPDVSTALAADSTMAASYPGVIDPNDTVIHKTTFSGVLSSDLVDHLRGRGFDAVVLGGLTTPVCVQTTAEDLSMLGFKVTVLSDSCASESIGRLSADDAHAVALERLAHLFASVISTSDFVASSRQNQ